MYAADEDAEDRHDRHERRAERTRDVRPRVRAASITPTHTITNASSVPIDTSSPSSAIGKKPATIAATMPVTIVVTYGVWNFGWTLPNTAGSSPSRLIEKKMRGWPRSITSTTDARPRIAPMLMK